MVHGRKGPAVIFGTNQKSWWACTCRVFCMNPGETRAFQPGDARSSPDRVSAKVCRPPAMTAATSKLSRLASMPAGSCVRVGLADLASTPGKPAQIGPEMSMHAS